MRGVVIEMFRNKIFDLSRTLSQFSNAWGGARGHHVHADQPKMVRILERREREAIQRMEFNRDMAKAYVPRMQQALR